MHVETLALARRVATLMLAAGIAGCSSSSTDSDGQVPDFEGTYSLSGTYDGRTGNSVQGTLTISDQIDGVATATVSLKLSDNGNVFFALNAADPGVSATSGPIAATLNNEGGFNVTYSGREVISGLDPASCCNYTFKLTGTLDGNRIDGRWTLTRDMPSFDQGSFSAVR